jgi:TolA-binding protein
MLKRVVSILLAMPLAWACGKSWPEPKQPMADAESASRSAREVGADTQPAAKLKVTLADEQIAEAKAKIADGDNERATYLLIRARADAELALALAHEQQALDEKQKAIDESKVTLDANGAKP